MSNETIYCTYLTSYSGNKLPQFYIGSTSVKNIKEGYHGSVKSKKYQKIWTSELKEKPYLFKTSIISYHTSREEAIVKEKFFQKSLNVVKSDMYINMSLAQPKGFFGMSVAGENNPNKKKDDIQKYNYRRGPMSEESREKMSKSRAGMTQMKHKTTGNVVLVSENDPRISSGELVGINLGRKFPNRKKKRPVASPKYEHCPHCGRLCNVSNGGAFTWHFDRCRKKSCG